MKAFFFAFSFFFSSVCFAAQGFYPCPSSALSGVEQYHLNFGNAKFTCYDDPKGLVITIDKIEGKTVMLQLMKIYAFDHRQNRIGGGGNGHLRYETYQFDKNTTAFIILDKNTKGQIGGLCIECGKETAKVLDRLIGK
jgi:hypothetical protein